MTIKKVGVCGAGGTMGAGIALVAARGGFETVCFDRRVNVRRPRNSLANPWKKAA
jgi:3-hydroxyacyl-CoA dehydrogenase